MAQRGLQLDHERYSCPICLDLLKDPTTLSCGHNYCMSCITKRWDEESQGGIHTCPQCRQTFLPKPVLEKNTMLEEIIKKLNTTTLQAAPHPKHYDGLGDVACDVCSGEKQKALKFCLQCVASYCELHLQPHDEAPIFLKHQLVEASAEFQEIICSVHTRVKEVFCRSDQQCICFLCAMDEHRDHDTVSAAAERTEKQRELRPMRLSIQLRIQDAQRDVEFLQQQLKAIDGDVDEDFKASQTRFSQMIQLVEKRSCEVKQQIRSQLQTEVSRAKELEMKLQQEIRELKRRDVELEKLPDTKEHSQFLLKYSSLSALSEPTRSAGINDRPAGCFLEVTEAVSELTEKLQSILSQDHTQISMTEQNALRRPGVSEEMVEDGDEEEVLKNLKSVVPPECFEYAEKLLKSKSVSHFELLKLYRVLAEKLQAAIISASLQSSVHLCPATGRISECQPPPLSASGTYYAGSSPSIMAPPSLFSNSRVGEGRISRQTTQSSHSSRIPFSSVFGSTVKVCCITTGYTLGAENIIEQMATQLKKVQITRREECDIIIVFCPIIARVGSDVEAALRREEVSSSDKPVILVLMHHTRDVEYSTGGRKWAQNDPKIVLEVVVLFHETQPGLLECDTNKEAIKEIQKVLQKHSKHGLWSKSHQQ